jgi:hypothetical protein
MTLVLLEMSNFIVIVWVWVALVSVLYALRVYCVSAIKSQSPQLYEQIGKPASVSRYSWRFLYVVSRSPPFLQLTRRTRLAVHGLQACFLIATVLSIALGCVTLVRLASTHHWL